MVVMKMENKHKKKSMTMEENERLAALIVNRFENYKVWLKMGNIPAIVKECQDFFYGNHWPKATEATKELPRPSFGLTALTINTQVSNILGSPTKLNYVAAGEDVASDVFTQFAGYQFKEAKFDDYLETIVQDSEVKGNGILYAYWDEFAKGRNGKYKGALRFSVLDLLDFAVANPTITDVQEQEWIIYPDRVSLKVARSMCKTLSKEQIMEKIFPDELDSDYKDVKELDGSQLTTVYTMFYRLNGEVCFVKATKNVVLCAETYMNPFISKKEIELDSKESKDIKKYADENDTKQEKKEDGLLGSQQDDELSIKKDTDYTFSLYPFGNLCTVPKAKSFVGLGTARTVVPNNKLINLVAAYNLMNVQNLAWGKVLVKHNALKGQKINNKPGQIIVDYSPGTGWGISHMPGQQTLSNGAIEQLNTYIELTRAMHNADEIMTGDMLSKNLSGTAIAQIEAMRTKNVDRKQKRVWRFIEDMGKIAYQFYVAYYKNEKFMYEMGEDMFIKASNQDPNVSRTQFLNVDGQEFLNYDFEIVCEVGAGSQFSEISQMQMLDNLLTQQHITFEQFVELYPANQMPFKNRIKQMIKAAKESELEQWKQAYMELTKQVESMQQQLAYETQKSLAMEKYANNLKKTYKETIDVKNNEILNMRDYMSKLPGSNAS